MYMKKNVAASEAHKLCLYPHLLLHLQFGQNMGDLAHIS